MRVLIVDDEVLITKCLARVALSRGHQVRTEGSGLKALRVWQEFQPHLVFLDILLPDLDGPSVLERAGKKHNEKVVMMSAHRAFSDGVSIPGVDLFVSKPFQDIVRFFKQAEGLFQIPLERSREKDLVL